KPFVYCAAIDNGWSPCDKLIDEAVEITYEEKGEIKKWSPNNAGGKFTKEEMSLRTAMSRSCNSITVQLSEKVGFQKVADYAQKMGVKSTLQPVPSIGLGSNEVSLLELVAAYGVFINQGVYCEPLLVSKITDRDGHVIKVFTSKSKKVLSDSTANKMVYMLKGGIDEVGGTSRSLLNYNRIVSGNDLGGKTGTTSNYSDGWFIGVTNKLIAGCWVGGDDRCIHFRESAKMEGAKTALPVFGIFLTKVYNDPLTKKYKSLFSIEIKEIGEKYDCEKLDSINNKFKNKIRTFFKNIFKKNKNKKETKTYSGKPKNK
ncbi:MAG TPA: penicillin-binding transpeptidase domain-containing protein, partial [Bacteroidales bacterium]|nr:penicillin-binding transpeptidase domain-containing protein [Bacteroidales bacterium]